MANTTYLLGAGASANAIPPVKQMNLRIWELYYTLKEFSLQNNLEIKKEFDLIKFDRFNYLLEKLENIISEITKHYSIDTYAKKLYLKKSLDYIILKHLINLYILFEQISIEEIQNQLKINYGVVTKNMNEQFGVQKSNDLEKYRVSNLDERYDVLLASIYDTTIKFPQNLKILTYNYDNQLEIANEYYKNYKSIYSHFYSLQGVNNPEINIIKLNGYATFEKVIKLGEFENTQITDTEFLKEKLKHQISKLNNLFNEQTKVLTNISFAWDESDYSTHAINKAREFILNSSNIVIVGYSFPEFNRKIDEILFSKLPTNAKIYIQTEENSFAILQDRLIQRAKKINQQNIIKVNYIDQFFIP